MSEKATFNPELSDAERHDDKNHEKQENRAETVNAETAKHHSEKLAHIRNEVSSEAKRKAEVAHFDTKSEHESSPHSAPPVNKELKKITLRKELTQIRRKLKRPDKLGSKFIHAPIVKTISEVSSKSISRPSGLLGGGLMAFIGSGLYYYLTKHIGFRYNYLVFAVLFVGGFIIGLVIELGIYTLSSKKSTK